jgi:Flp pilus assembly pilin Flp
MEHQRISSAITSRFRKECGQDLAEYGLLVGFIAIIVVGGATLFGENLLALFDQLRAGLGLPW